MIRGDVTPIGHKSPYKRIDPSHPGRPARISQLEVEQRGGRTPDPAVYWYSIMLDCWLLKDGM